MRRKNNYENFKKGLRSKVELYQEERIFEDIVNLLPANIYWKDRSGVFLGCNNRVAKILKLKNPNKIIGKNNADLFDTALAKETSRIDNLIFSKKKEISLEETGIDANGNVTTYLTTKSPLHDRKGNLKGLLGVSLDISDRKKMEQDLKKAKEQAEAASQAKSDFIANMQHDLRTPIGHIVGMAERLKKAIDVPDRMKQQFELIESSGRRVLALVSEILEFVNLESGQIVVRDAKFNLGNLIKMQIDIFTPEAKEKKVKLYSQVDSKIPQVLIGDQGRIARIIMNLLSNALKFTHKGHVKITAKLLKRMPQNRAVVALIVEDTGIGIPEEKQDEIFEKFVRLTAAHENKFQGLGLGLAIVKQFVDELDGEIDIQSKEGKGAKFTCLLPLRVSLHDKKYIDNSKHGIVTKQRSAGSADQAKPLVSRSNYDARNNLAKSALNTLNSKDSRVITKNNKYKRQSEIVLTKSNDNAKYKIKNVKHVLLIEDEEIGVIVAKGNLEDLGCSVDAVKTCKEAADHINRNKYDLILLDIGLPDGNGIELVKSIKQKHPKLLTPIVVLTAHGNKLYHEAYEREGISGYIEKPMDFAKTQKVFKEWLNKKRRKKV